MRLNRRSDIVIGRFDQVCASSEVFGTGYIEHLEEDEEDVSYVAVRGTKVVGVLDIERKSRKSQKTVSSRHTCISRAARKCGVGTMLWNEMIKVEKPTRINVTVVTKGGKRLIESLQRKHKRIKWNVEDNTRFE